MFGAPAHPPTAPRSENLRRKVRSSWPNYVKLNDSTENADFSGKTARTPAQGHRGCPQAPLGDNLSYSTCLLFTHLHFQMFYSECKFVCTMGKPPPSAKMMARAGSDDRRETAWGQADRRPPRPQTFTANSGPPQSVLSRTYQRRVSLLIQLTSPLLLNSIVPFSS